MELNKKIIKSTNVHVLTHISKNETFREIPALFELTASTFSPGKIIPEQLQEMFGELSKSIKKNKEPQSIISKISLITLNGWKPLAVCCSSKDDLLVTVQTDDEKENKVVRYEGSKALQEIRYKDHNIALYSNPLFICEL